MLALCVVDIELLLHICISSVWIFLNVYVFNLCQMSFFWQWPTGWTKRHKFVVVGLNDEERKTNCSESCQSVKLKCFSETLVEWGVIIYTRRVFFRRYFAIVCSRLKSFLCIWFSKLTYMQFGCEDDKKWFDPLTTK